MKFGKNKLAVALGAVLSVGMASQASADVYGLGYLDVDNLLISANTVSGGASRYTFSNNQDAILNNNADPIAGNASCNGNFGAGTTNCSIAPPTLSGPAQNAPFGTGPIRGESDYTQYGQVGNYSSSEAEVVEATLTGDAKTHVELITESNLANDGGQSAQANNSILSNTTLNLAFAGGVGGVLTVTFDAAIDVQAEVNNGDGGLAQAAATTTLTLVKDGITIASWSPNGLGSVFCAVPGDCVVDDSAGTLNYTATSEGDLNQVVGSGSYRIDIAGLTDGVYTLALYGSTGTDLIRDVPVPGTLLLMGTGLLLGARATRRNKKK